MVGGGLLALRGEPAKVQGRGGVWWPLCCVLALVLFGGCKSPQEWRQEADSRAHGLLETAQQGELGRTERIEIESPSDTLRRRLLLDQQLPSPVPASLSVHDLEATEHWDPSAHLLPGSPYTREFDSTKEIRLSLLEAIRVAARNNREFQNEKEKLFQSALALDLESDDFRSTFQGMMRGEVSTSKPGGERVSGAVVSPGVGVTRTFSNGVELMSRISVDLAKMLTGGSGSSFGLSYDGSVMIPLMRGSGEFVVLEPLTQAQRNLVYAIRQFEQYKRQFVVRIATSYLGALRAHQSVANQVENYKRVVTSTRRSRRMADAGLMPEYQFDQSIQTELGARMSWVSSKQSLLAHLEAFRVLLGLPPDSKVFPLQSELDSLVEVCEKLAEGVVMADYSGKIPSADASVELKEPDRRHSGPNEIDSGKALRLAFACRLDLRNLRDQVEDAQRGVVIAADNLRGEVTLGGKAGIGESRGVYGGDQADGSFRPNHGNYNALLNIDLPFHRTAERNRYRNSLIALERSVRAYQALEDGIKQEVYGVLRDLLEHREGMVIQVQAVRLAERRVKSTDLLLQAGRAELRDVLEAQSALLGAQNALYSAVVSYRVNELELQRILGVLEVSEDGVWQELDLRRFK